MSEIQSPSKDMTVTVGAPRADAFRALRDVEVELSLEIGRRRMRIDELLHVSVGQIVELSTSAGDPIDIFVNGQLLARGKAIVVNDRYAVRITEIVGDGDHE